MTAPAPAAPDYEYWSCMARWSHDQAAALSFDLDPDWLADDGEVERLLGETKDALAKRCKLVANHVATGRIPHDVEPAVFLSWARSNGIACSEALSDAVARHGGAIADWRHQNEMLRAERTADKARIAELEARNAVLESGLGAPLATTKEGVARNLKAETSLLKMVLGMAMAKFGYRPGLARSSATKSIVDALACFGIFIDDQTVLDRLRKAAEEVEHQIPGNG